MRRRLALTFLLLGLLAGPGLAHANKLAGADWVLAGETGRAATYLRFDGARVSGLGGCNQFSGGYETAGDKLTFSPLVATRMACEPDRMQKEQAFFEMLGQVKGVKVNGDRLELFDGAGKLLASFTRRAE